MQNDLGRLMTGVFQTNGRSTEAWVPALDVWETDAELVYAFDLPGVAQENISIEVENGELSVSATRERQHKLEDGRYYRFERRHGEFTRTVGLPPGTTDADISASFADGVLEVHVRKPETAKPKRIEISIAGTPSTIEGSAEPVKQDGS